MTSPRQRSQRPRWLAASFFMLVAACDDKSSGDAEQDEQEHEHEHDSEHIHGGTSSSSEKSGGSAGKAGSGERTDSSKGETAKAGAGGKAGAKDADDEPVHDETPDAGAAEPAAGSGGAGGARAAEAGAGGKAAGDAPAGGVGGASGEPENEGGSGAAESGNDVAVTIRFKAMVGDEALACGTSYAMQGDPATEVTPQDFRLFIQDLALIKEDGTRVPIKNAVRAPWQSETVALLDFEDATGNCAGTPETNDEITGTVPKGTYKGLSFANGVPEALNHSDPTHQADPLKSSASLSWSWLSGFRFAKVELVKTDPESFGEGVFHPGSQACSGNPSAGNVMCSKPNRNEVLIDSFDADKDSVLIDVGALFKSTDMNMDSACHSGEKAVCEAMFDAWGINFADGKPKTGQSVFKTR